MDVSHCQIKNSALYKTNNKQCACNVAEFGGLEEKDCGYKTSMKIFLIGKKII